MTDRIEWIHNSLRNLYPYRHYSHNISFFFYNDTLGIEYRRKTQYYLKLYHYKDGEPILDKRGKHKYTKFEDLHKLAKRHRIRVILDFEGLRMEAFLRSRKDTKHWNTPKFKYDWRLLSLPRYFGWYSDHIRIIWNATKPSINLSNLAKQILSHFGIDQDHCWVSDGGVVYPIFTNANVWGYLKQNLGADQPTFDIVFQFHYRSNFSNAIDTIHHKYQPIYEIPIVKLNGIETIVFRKNLYQKTLWLRLAKDWDYGVFPVLRVFCGLFGLFAHWVKRWQKNFARRIQKWITPVLSGFFYWRKRVLLNNYTAKILFVDTLLKPLIFYRLSVLEFLDETVFYFLNGIGKIYTLGYKRHQELMENLLRTLFNPLRKIGNSVKDLENRAWRFLNRRCLMCNGAIHHNEIMERTKWSRNMVIQNFLNSIYYPEQQALQPLRFVCCSCFPKLQKKEQDRLLAYERIRKVFEGLADLFKFCYSLFLNPQLYKRLLGYY